MLLIDNNFPPYSTCNVYKYESFLSSTSASTTHLLFYRGLVGTQRTRQTFSFLQGGEVKPVLA